MKAYTNGLFYIAEYRMRELFNSNTLEGIAGYTKIDAETVDINNMDLGILEKNILKKLTKEVGKIVINNKELYITELNNIPVDIVVLKQLITNTLIKSNRLNKEKILKF